MASESTSRAPTAVGEGHQLAGRYVLRTPIASGGMAQVWEADDTVLDRLVAVKILHPHLAGDPEFVTRFRNEAKAAARLSHQSIVAIFDTASEDGVEAMIMELIDGLTLRQYLDDHGPLSVDDAADLTSQIADALDTAHAARLVHRDIKPGNIILCPDRRTKVTDFGIAKALEGDDLTTSGTILGTAKYLAPEQVEGTPVDQRADIYSLGVVLFEALTGRAPFDEATDSATALARLRVDPPSARALNPRIPPAVERVLLTALSRNRDRRYPSAGAMSEAFRAAVAQPIAVVDPTITAAGQEKSGSGALAAHQSRAEPEHTAELPDRTPRQRRVVGPTVMLLVLAGCLALGIALILATGVGRDFFDRVGDLISGDEQEPASESPTLVTSIGSDSSEESSVGVQPTAPDAAPVSSTGPSIAEVRDFDPLGDGEERRDLIALAYDGDTETLWRSEGYSNRSLGNLKAGIGVVILLESEATLNELSVTSPTQGWAASIYTAKAPAADLEAWGDILDARVNIEGNTTFDLRGVRASAVLVWVTDLGDAPPKLRMEIAELRLS